VFVVVPSSVTRCQQPPGHKLHTHTHTSRAHCDLIRSSMTINIRFFFLRPSSIFTNPLPPVTPTCQMWAGRTRAARTIVVYRNERWWCTYVHYHIIRPSLTASYRRRRAASYRTHTHRFITTIAPIMLYIAFACTLVYE